jgi:lysophospholipase L1-like esterase
MMLEPKLRGVSAHGIHSTNSWGFRGDEPPRNWSEHFTIVTIGGSTTQCFYLDDRKTWPWLMQEYLKAGGFSKVWVGNGGIDGQTTRAHLHFMEEIISVIKPNVVVLLVGINDLGLSLNSNWLKEGSPYDIRGMDFKNWVYQRSSLIRFLYIYKQILFDQAYVVQTHHTSSGPKKMATNERGFNVEIPRRHLDAYSRNLTAIIESGRSSGVRLIFLTQPLLYDDSDAWKDFEGGMYWLDNRQRRISAADLRRLLNRFNEELMIVCQKNGVECIDVANTMPISDKFFYDACHFTEAGADELARIVSQYLATWQGRQTY